MKSFLFLVAVFASLAGAQSVTSSYTNDINGRRVAGPSVIANDGEQTQITQSINGRQVPMEQSQERVISDGPSGRVVERVTRRFDPNGHLAAVERVVTQEEKVPGGLNTRSTVYYGNVEGQLHEVERRTEETRTQGAVTNNSKEIAKPGVDGSFQTVEKQVRVAETSGDATHSDQTVYRKSQNGDYYPAVRDVTDVSKSGSQVTEKSAHYEPRGTQSMTLTAQSVVTTAKKADGSEVSQVELFATSSGDGRVHDNETAPHLREIQTVERTVGAGGSVTQTVTAQRPTISDPNRLGAAKVISETVCTGKCTGVGFMH